MVAHGSKRSKNILEFSVGAVPVRLYVDSGADVSILTAKTWKRLMCEGVIVQEVNHRTEQKIQGIAQGTELHITTSFTAEVIDGEFKTVERFFVADNAAEDILSDEAAKELHCLTVGHNVYRAEKTVSGECG